jgi:hypothetical protein
VDTDVELSAKNQREGKYGEPHLLEALADSVPSSSSENEELHPNPLHCMATTPLDCIPNSHDSIPVHSNPSHSKRDNQRVNNRE